MAGDVAGDNLVDLVGRQPTLLLAGPPRSRNVLVFGGSADHLLKSSPQFLFREQREYLHHI